MCRIFLIAAVSLVHFINVGFGYEIRYSANEIEIKNLLATIKSNDENEEVTGRIIHFRTHRQGPEELTGDVLEKQIHILETTVGEETAFQPWSILWYIGSFGGLIAFFLIVSCSEWCCRARRRRQNSQEACSTPTPSEAPPPAYDLFAPPSYDSLCSSGEKREYDVYVVPVHVAEAGAQQRADADAPPAYCADLFRNNAATSDEVVLNIRLSDNDGRERSKTDQRERATQT